MPMQPRPELLDLPDDALHRVLELGQLRPRLFLMATCKRLKDLGDSSPTLWADLAVRGNKRKLQSLCAWLACSSKQVRRLKLTPRDYTTEHANHEEEDEEEEEPDPVYDYAILQEALVSAALVGSRLESLVLQWHGNMEVAGWVVAMPRLRRLGLTSESEGCVAELRITRHLGSLHQLDTLAIDANSLHMEVGCLPTSLRTLCLELGGNTDYLPTALTVATQLRCLTLRHAICDCPDLLLLAGSLTRLELVDFEPAEHGVPLSEMTALRQLEVTDRGFMEEGALVIDPGRGLSGLTHLTRLDFYGLSADRHPTFCASLGQLTALRMLSLRGADLEGGVPLFFVLEKLGQVETLELAFHSLEPTIAALAVLPSLRSLCLHARFAHQPDPDPASLVKLLQQLPCPQLTALHFNSSAALTIAANEVLFADVRRQLACRGITELKDMAQWDAAHKLPLLPGCADAGSQPLAFRDFLCCVPASRFLFFLPLCPLPSLHPPGYFLPLLPTALHFNLADRKSVV